MLPATIIYNIQTDCTTANFSPRLELTFEYEKFEACESVEICSFLHPLFAAVSHGSVSLPFLAASATDLRFLDDLLLADSSSSPLALVFSLFEKLSNLSPVAVEWKTEISSHLRPKHAPVEYTAQRE